MPLLKLFEADKDGVLELPIDIIVKMAGEKLLDDSATSKEFRSFLEHIESEPLSNYAQQCLDKGSKFDDKGLVLQDIVNDIGRRLEFDVKPGLYHGKVGEIGYDGIWRDKKKNTEIIVEVKTASHITIKLDTIANYKRQLVKEGKISESASTLIVVGREGTAPIEAQIRGSRYAWEMRLISVKSLLKLLHIKLKYDNDMTINTIKGMLQPFEYTKIDKIIDIVFTTTENEDVESQDEDAPDMDDGNKRYIQTHTKREIIKEKRSRAIEALGKKLNVSFLQRRRSLFYDQDEKWRACVSVSKRFQPGNDYWYGHNESQKVFLEGSKESYLVLACVDKSDICFAIPYHFVKKNLKNLVSAKNPDGTTHWHIHIFDKGKEGMLWNMAEGRKEPIPPDYIIPMTTEPGESS